MYMEKIVEIYDPFQDHAFSYEEKITLLQSDGNLTLTVIYGSNRHLNKKNVEFVFESTLYYQYSSSPGISMRKYDFEVPININLTSLIEIIDHKPIKLWEEHFNNLFKLKYYSIVFIDENKIFDVIARNVKIIEKML